MKTSKIRNYLASLCLAGACLASAAQAVLIITPTSGVLNTSRWEIASNANLNAAGVASAVGTPAVALTEVYKMDVSPAAESGSFASSYTTTFSNSSNDPQDSNITHVANTPVLSATPLYLLIKDGNQLPGQYIFDLNAFAWNGLEEIFMDGFWPQQGAISHIAIYAGRSTSVPDGGATVALMGLALGGLGFGRRFIRKA